MIKFIDNFLNRITMYRLVLYILALLLLVAEVLSVFGILPYGPFMLLLSTLILLTVCWFINWAFSSILNVPTNVESVYITALILALIVTPPESIKDISYFIFIFWVAIWAMASKFILTIGKKHIFNPAAFAVALTALTINQSASWWVGTAWMAPFVLTSGLLIVRKTKRFDLVSSFVVISLIATFILHAGSIGDIPKLFERAILASPLLFFAFIMLTEPLTTPPTKYLRMGYGVLVGIMFDPMMHFGSLYSTPELALVFGNIFSYIVSPKKRLLLKLKGKKEIAKDTYDFSFTSHSEELSFHPGQYLEWTLAHPKPDSRGNRRYFTIASTPVEEELSIGVKFYSKPSSFKNAMMNMKTGDTIVAAQLAGDFTLPHNKEKKLCFIAGGIGITPFRSMIAHMLERKQKRNVVMFYSCKTIEEIAYVDTLEKARNELGINTIYALSDLNSIPADWMGARGSINGEMIMGVVPDYKERMYYISGPHSMVTAFEKTLSEMGIHRSHIKTDFFPGFV